MAEIDLLRAHVAALEEAVDREIGGAHAELIRQYTDPKLSNAARRPRDRRAAEQSDERAADHSITSSARASSDGGTSMPSALAVVRLMIRSNLLGCSTGISAGFVPRRTLST